MSEWFDITSPDFIYPYEEDAVFDGAKWSWDNSSPWRYAVTFMLHTDTSFFTDNSARLIESIRVTLQNPMFTSGSEWLLDMAAVGLYSTAPLGGFSSVFESGPTPYPFAGTIELTVTPEVMPLVDLDNVYITMLGSGISVAGALGSISKIELKLSGTSARWHRKVRTVEAV